MYVRIIKTTQKNTRFEIPLSKKHKCVYRSVDFSYYPPTQGNKITSALLRICILVEENATRLTIRILNNEVKLNYFSTITKQ